MDFDILFCLILKKILNGRLFCYVECDNLLIYCI